MRRGSDPNGLTVTPVLIESLGVERNSVDVVDYDQRWLRAYQEVEAKLRRVLGETDALIQFVLENAEQLAVDDGWREHRGQSMERGAS